MNPIRHARTQQQRRVHSQIDNSRPYAFFNLLTSPELLGEVESLLPRHRERLFPPTETLSMFLAQALSADGSCQNVVNAAAMQRLVGGLTVCSTHTGGYCKARQRLPEAMVSALVKQTGKLVAKNSPRPGLGRGRPVRLIDGTTVTLPDTAANQARYPQQG